MKTVAVIPGGGSGKRLRLKVKKPFVPVGGIPLIVHCARVLNASPSIDGIIVAVERSSIGRFRGLAGKYRLDKVRSVVAGGATRFESVRNCLAGVDRSYGMVLIHDAARPFIDERLIRRSLAAAKRYGAAVVCIPEKDTVKSADARGTIRGTVDRQRLWRAQTPQAFKRRVIVDAYRRSPRAGAAATDDSSLVERTGAVVKIVPGSDMNIKITTREDLALADALMRAKRGRRR